MTWIFFALGARFLWSWTNIGDRFLLTKKIKNPLVYLVVGFLVDIFIIPLWLFFGLQWYGWNNLFLIIFQAILFFSGTFLYILSIQREEASRVNLLWNIMPLHGLWLSWLILGEKLSNNQLLALLILLIASILAGLHAVGKEKFKFSVSFWLMLASTFLYVSADVITRYLTQNNISALHLAGYQLFILPILAGLFFFFKNFRQQFYLEKNNYTWKILLILVVMALFSRVGVLFNMKALSYGHIALVNVLEGAQAIMVFLIALLFTYFAPKIIKEEIDRKNLILKLVALVLMVVGIAVLNLNV